VQDDEIADRFGNAGNPERLVRRRVGYLFTGIDAIHRRLDLGICADG
jgi:hypothetical protein